MPASNNTQVTQEANVAAVVIRGQLKRSGSGRRKAVFPMLHPNSVRQRFIQPRLFMVYSRKNNETMIPLTGRRDLKKDTHYEGIVFVRPHDQSKRPQSCTNGKAFL